MRLVCRGFIGFIAIGLPLWVATQAHAATLSLAVPGGQNFSIGQEFTINLLLDTEGKDVNAIQATINYPSTLLQFISADRSNSAFQFWIEEPTASQGALRFIAGSLQKVSGKSLLVFAAKFKSAGAGKAEFLISDGVLTASDDHGENVLTSVSGANIIISPPILQPLPIQEQPQLIIRKAVPAKGLPGLPNVRIGAYPDPSRWYNHRTNIIVLWDIPEDVVQVAAALNQNPKTSPLVFENELVNGKSFEPVQEGIWYIHVRFKNNIGVGPIAHYRIAIDTTPPPPFQVAVDGVTVEGDAIIRTDNPRPLLKFIGGNDALSGTAHYVIRVDSQAAVMAEGEEFQLNSQIPGQKKISISVVDKAGNVQEHAILIDILPITAPAISFISSDVFAGEGDLLVRGSALPETTVKVVLIRESGKPVAGEVVPVLRDGEWQVIFRESLGKGRYVVQVTARDERGALSLPVKSDLFVVRGKPIFSIGGIGVTSGGLLALLINIFVIVFISYLVSYRVWQRRLNQKMLIAEREIVSFSKLISTDLEKILEFYKDKKLDEREGREILFYTKRIYNNLERMQKYAIQNIEDILK